MAADKKNTAAAAPTGEFDWSKFLPEEYSAEQFSKVGGLIPIYNAQKAFEEGWNPVVGHAVKIMSIQIVDTEPPRPFLLVELTGPTKGTVGSSDKQKIVDLVKGNDILMPLSGNIRNIDALQTAVADEKNVYLVGFRIMGQEKVNKMPSAMWLIDARVHPPIKERTGRFALAIAERRVQQLATSAGVTSNGTPFDKDGVVQAELVS